MRRPPEWGVPDKPLTAISPDPGHSEIKFFFPHYLLNSPRTKVLFSTADVNSKSERWLFCGVHPQASIPKSLSPEVV